MGGDIYFRIMISPHKIFKRKGADLFIEKTITLKEALSGFYTEINHFNNKKFTICTIPNEIIKNG